MTEEKPDRLSLTGIGMRAIAAVLLAVLLVTLIALGVAWLTPGRESLLRVVALSH